jgi:imidazolonepropionase
MQVDLLIHSAAQLVTCASPNEPKRGAAMRDVGVIEDGAIAIADGLIVAVGHSDEIRNTHSAHRTLDARDKVVCPGFVDPHTHVVFAGDRVNEFELCIQGASYMDIMAAGGGIVSTVCTTREASLERIVLESRKRLDAMVQLGTTTAEAKSGYGLDTTTELKLLRAIEELDRTHAIDLIPTFMGAHAIPPEFKGRADDYADLVVDEMLPAAAAWYRQSRFASGRPFFCDVFCEQNAFDVAQSRRVLQAAQAHGLGIKAHVDEFTSLGGVAMALQLGATSIDHLDVTTNDDKLKLANSNTIGVVIPVVNFNLGSAHFADAHGLIDAGAAIALSTDINPGSAPCPSMPLVMAIACRYQKLTPAETLNACTINAAHAIGMGHRVGSLEVGKQADVLIVDAPDYRHLAYQFGVNLVEMVIKRGKMERPSPLGGLGR